METQTSSSAKISFPSDREIVIVRGFRAPPSALFDAWSKPEHVRRWYVCPTMTMPVCEIDFRVGGKWRWVQHDAVAGIDHVLSGEYLEIAPSERIVFTERYEPIPGSDHVVTLTFGERDGITTVTQHIVHPSNQGRDGHLQSGIESGLHDTFERLDRVLASMVPS